MATSPAASATKNISPDRKRTNLFRVPEQATIAFLCRWLPSWVSSDMLTFIGFLGSVIVFAGFFFAKADNNYLALSILGFAIQWFGDSLDGRIAYYRNIPRKWYGFSLDMSMDWISTILIGLGFYFYLDESYKILAFTFVTAYAWTMLLALLKYKITGNYAIDSGLFGPTELRIGICLVLLGAIFYPTTITVFAVVINLFVYALNCIDFYKVLQLGNARDREENAKR